MTACIVCPGGRKLQLNFTGVKGVKCAKLEGDIGLARWS